MGIHGYNYLFISETWLLVSNLLKGRITDGVVDNKLYRSYCNQQYTHSPCNKFSTRLKFRLFISVYVITGESKISSVGDF